MDKIFRKDKGATRPPKAVNNKQLINIKKILNRGESNVNRLNKYGFYPLYIAVFNNEVSIVKRLLERGTSEINKKNKDGLTSLHLASINNYANIVKMLLKYGANPDVKDSNGLTPMHWVIIKDNVNMAKILMEYDTSLKKNNTIIYLRKIMDSPESFKDKFMKFFVI